MAHLVDGKAANQRPAYYGLVKFAVEKEAEINFNKAKKTKDSTLKPKVMMHFHFNSKKSMLLATPAVQMVAPAPEERSGEGEATPLPCEESDSGESYKASQEDATVSQGDIGIAVRVAQAILQRHLQVNVSGATRSDIDSMMRSVKCMALNFKTPPRDLQRPERADRSLEHRPVQDYRDKGNSLRATPLKLNETKEIEVGGKEEVQAHKAHALPFPRDCPNLSPTDLLARKKHDAMPPQLLKADPFAQIIGTETVADVIIDDVEAFALLEPLVIS